MLKLLLLVGALLGPAVAEDILRVECNASDEDIYQFSANDIYGNETITFDRYAGKVVLIYNVATYCEGTIPSYTQINALAELYAGQDLEILAFPCNQFGKQEPGATAEEILDGVRWVRPGGDFVPLVDQFFEKSEVNGATEIPLYTYLKGNCGMTATEFLSDIFYTPFRVGDVIWNFEKFLIGRDGKPYIRYSRLQREVEDLSPDIDYLLAQPSPTD